MKDILSLIRVHQWVKNLFIFIPAFFGSKLNDPQSILQLAAGFFCFSLVASSIYIINDYVDIEKDKEHPEKRNRPLASGAISKGSAKIIFAVVFLVGIVGAILLNPIFAAIVGGYFVMNLFYSFKLKQIALVDITLISIGFILRIFAGGAIINIYMSHWLILMTFLLAMLLALAKRRDDLIILSESGKQMRKSLEGYSMEFVNASMVFMSSVTLVSYIMYTVDDEIISRFGEHFYLSTLFVLLGLLRYLQIAFVENKTGSPTKIFLKDRLIQIVILAWIITCGVLLYAQKS